MIQVTPRARSHDDKAGDPLDGLVNLFDLGIVLSVGFLLAALSALGATSSIAATGDPADAPADTVRVPRDSTIESVPADGQKVVGRGERVGAVYRLDDGRLVYVVPPESSGAARGEGTTPAPGGGGR